MDWRRRIGWLGASNSDFSRRYRKLGASVCGSLEGKGTRCTLVLDIFNTGSGCSLKDADIVFLRGEYSCRRLKWRRCNTSHRLLGDWGVATERRIQSMRGDDGLETKPEQWAVESVWNDDDNPD